MDPYGCLLCQVMSWRLSTVRFVDGKLCHGFWPDSCQRLTQFRITIASNLVIHKRATSAGEVFGAGARYCATALPSSALRVSCFGMVWPYHLSPPSPSSQFCNMCSHAFNLFNCFQQKLKAATAFSPAEKKMTDKLEEVLQVLLGDL